MSQSSSENLVAETIQELYRKTKQPPNFNFQKLAFSINETLEMLPLGRTKLYSEIKAGRLKITKFGKSSWVMADDLADFLKIVSEGGAKCK